MQSQGSKPQTCKHRTRRKVVQEREGKERVSVRRYDQFVPIRQDEPYKDRLGNGRQACAITEPPLEARSGDIWESMRGKRMQVSSKGHASKKEGERRSG